jgi:hypothetical protein
MHLTQVPIPVEQGYGGGDQLNIRRLYDFCVVTHGNFTKLQSELDRMQEHNAIVSRTNRQLTQLLNWIAVTNPQILDEFQTTAHAFDKLLPRDAGDSDVACAQA